MKKILFSVISSNFIAAGLGFLIKVILARFLNISYFGRINLIFTIVVMMFTIADFGICNSFVIFYNRTKDKIKYDPIYYFNSIYIKYLFIIFILSIPAILVIKSVYNFSLKEILVILTVFYFFLVFRYLNSINQAKGKWLTFNLLNIFNNFSKLICFAISALLFYYSFHYFTKYQSILAGYFGYAFLLIIISFLVNRKYIKSNSEKIEQKYVKELKSILIPIGLANVFIIVTMRFGDLIIAKVLGNSKLGIYSAANTLALVFPLITSSIMNVFLKEAAGKKKQFLAKILMYQKKYFGILILILVLVIIFSKYFILFLFGSEYNEAINIFRILIIAYIGGIFFTPMESYFYGNKQKIILWMKLTQMLIVVIGSIILIDYLGLYGVATVVVLSRIFGWFYIYNISQNILGKITDNHD